MVGVISDRPLEGAQHWLASLVEEFPEGVKSASVVFLLENGEIETGYFNMSVADKMLASGMFQADITHDIIQVNYPELADDDPEDGDEEDEE